MQLHQKSGLARADISKTRHADTLGHSPRAVYEDEPRTCYLTARISLRGEEKWGEAQPDVRLDLVLVRPWHRDWPESATSKTAMVIDLIDATCYDAMVWSIDDF